MGFGLAYLNGDVWLVSRRNHVLKSFAGTVRNYLTTTVTKLNARNRIDAIRIAREAGWL